MLFQNSKLKAPTSLFTETWQKRRSSFELWAFEKDTPSGIGCISKSHIIKVAHVYVTLSSRRKWHPKWDCCFKTQSSKLQRVFSLKRGKRDVRALSFELSKMTPQVGLAVYRLWYTLILIYSISSLKGDFEMSLIYCISNFEMSLICCISKSHISKSPLSMWHFKSHTWMSHVSLLDQTRPIYDEWTWKILIGN